MMQFMNLEDGKLIFCVPLSKCNNCHKPMMKWYENIPDTVLFTAKQNGIVKESYQESCICTDCVEKGGFSKTCDLCAFSREFPREFKYRILHRASYPEEDNDFEYICSHCIIERPQDVIEHLANSDKTSLV